MSCEGLDARTDRKVFHGCLCRIEHCWKLKGPQILIGAVRGHVESRLTHTGQFLLRRIHPEKRSPYQGRQHASVHSICDHDLALGDDLDGFVQPDLREDRWIGRGELGVVRMVIPVLIGEGDVRSLQEPLRKFFLCLVQRSKLAIRSNQDEDVDLWVANWPQISQNESQVRRRHFADIRSVVLFGEFITVGLSGKESEEVGPQAVHQEVIHIHRHAVFILVVYSLRKLGDFEVVVQLLRTVAENLNGLHTVFLDKTIEVSPVASRVIQDQTPVFHQIHYGAQIAMGELGHCSVEVIGSLRGRADVIDRMSKERGEMYSGSPENVVAHVCVQGNVHKDNAFDVGEQRPEVFDDPIPDVSQALLSPHLQTTELLQEAYVRELVFARGAAVWAIVQSHERLSSNRKSIRPESSSVPSWMFRSEPFVWLTSVLPSLILSALPKERPTHLVMGKP